MKKTSYGFTLAETLITLAIIGVIASITIPSLKKSADEQEIVAGLKKAFSTLSNAVSRSEIDNSSVKRWNFKLSNEEFYKTYFKDYLNVSRECGKVTSACFGETIKYAGNGNNFDSNAYGVILADGSRIAFLNQTAHVHLMYDVNGEKKPNSIGMDTFVFTLTPKAFTESGTHKVDAPGLYAYGTGLSRNEMLSQCKKQGDACTGLIILDGYQIKSDFPW